MNRVKQVAKFLGRSAAFLTVLICVYGLILVYPQPAFPYRADEANISVWSSEPLPAEVHSELQEIYRRVSSSPLFNGADHYNVYLCQSPSLFAFFANYKRRVGGITYAYFNQNIFLRPSRVEHNRLLGPSGTEVPGDRTLVYFVTHELTHAMTVRAVGRLRYARLGRWRQEGYADYIAKGEPLDIDRWSAALVMNDPRTSFRRSGLYLRYHLRVAYLLDRQHVSVNELLSREWDVRQIQEDLQRIGSETHSSSSTSPSENSE